MKIRNTSRKAQKVRHVGPRAEKVSVAEVAEALGAERVGEAGRGGGPLALFALRQELASRLRSTGGRRRLAGTTRRQKIPLGEMDWLVLEYMASRLRGEGGRPTASQVASTLLRRALGEHLRAFAGQVPQRLREPPLLLWLFAEAVRRSRPFADEADARRQLLAAARAQADAGEISDETLRKLSEADDELPQAYEQARATVQLPPEQAAEEHLL